jgi:DNA-binding Lrp family transcriptional regulator
MVFKYSDYDEFDERRISPTEIGRRLGLDEKTVRLRIKKMEDGGFIKYYQALPNLALLDIKTMGFCVFEAVDIPSKREAMEYFRSAPWVVDIIDLLGPSFAAWVAASSPDQTQQMLNELTEKLGLKGASKFVDRSVKAPSQFPDRLDWQIIQRLRYDALCPTGSVAEALSITYRMVEYRIRKMLEAKGLYIRAMINPQKQEGMIFYTLSLSVNQPDQPHILIRLKEMFGEKCWYLRGFRSGFVTANLFSLTSGEPEEALMEALKLQGVRRGSLAITKEYIEPNRPNWIDGLIKNNIAVTVPQ